MPARDGKLVSLPSLARRRLSWRRAGKKVVFTNGIFDFLHRGHVEYLARAKSLGDILVIGLNTDASARRLKGSTRPYNKLADRAAVLGGLESVDYIVSFGESTPIRLIKALKPDILVKGTEYKKRDIVGAGEVELWGGKVVRMPMRRGLSTTALVRRIVRRSMQG